MQFETCFLREKSFFPNVFTPVFNSVFILAKNCKASYLRGFKIYSSFDHSVKFLSTGQPGYNKLLGAK
jgi:hypothetical protein